MLGLRIKTRGISGLVRAYFTYFFCLPITLPILGLVTVWTTSCVQKSDQKIESSSVLRLWKASHGETRQDFEHVIAPFLEQNPDLHIEVLAHPWEGWDERYAIAYTGGIPPDIAYMPDEFWPRFAAAGKGVDLRRGRRTLRGEVAQPGAAPGPPEVDGPRREQPGPGKDGTQYHTNM